MRWIVTTPLSDGEIRSLQALLSPDEKARADGFHFEADRIAYTAAHALTRSVLAGLTQRPPLSWQFQLGPFSKPEPVSEAGEPEIGLSLSHTRGLAVMAASIALRIGVDAEPAERRAPLEIVQDYFTAEEAKDLNSCHTIQKDARFFAFWTAKEAYVKATGTGLGTPFNSFSVALDPPRLCFGSDDVEPSHWAFCQFTLDTGHVVALAVETKGGPCPPIDKAPADFEFLGQLAGKA